MKFSHKYNIFLLALLIILNLLLRWFVSNHELMIDSYEMHLLANSISEFGEARWWVSPLSIVGMYPNSYASMISFLISGMSQINGISIDKAIFIYSILFGLLSIFGSYLLAGMLYDDDFYKFVVAFGFSLSPGVLAYTTWTANARSPFIIILPLFFYALLKSNKNFVKFKLICIIFAILLFVTHHMSYYLFLLFASYSIVKIIYFVDINKYVKYAKLNDFLPLITASAFILLFLYTFLTGKFLTVSSKWDNLFQMITEYPRYIGVLIFLSIGGLVHLLFKPNKRKEEWILLCSLVLLTPLLPQMMYTKWFILIFAFLLAGIGFLSLVKISVLNKKYVSVIIVFLLLSVTFSGYYQYLNDRKFDTMISDNEYFTSMWIEQFSDGTHISNNRWDGWKISSFSGGHFLTGSSTSDQAYGFIDVKAYNLTNVPITSEDFWLSSPFKRIDGYTSDGYWHVIMKRDIDNNWNKQLMNKFQIVRLVEHTLYNNQWLSHHGVDASLYVISVSTSKDCIYDSGDFNIWNLV